MVAGPVKVVGKDGGVVVLYVIIMIDLLLSVKSSLREESGRIP